jgi:hypothetical protein
MSVHQVPRMKFLENLRETVLGGDRVVTLVIGEIARWVHEGRTMPDVEDLTYVDFDELTEETLKCVSPDVVLSPLLTNAFDSYQIVGLLASLGYRGRYRALAQKMPNFEMIKAEVRSAGPAIDFDIVIMPPNLASVA